MPEQRVLFARYGALLQQMAANDVALLAGSDAGFGYLYHGFSLHDELATLVIAGLTPLHALQAATINPARCLNATDSLGTLAQGKVADIVLLEDDPLRDIRNTTGIRGVILNGDYLDRRRLDALLDDAARATTARR